MSLALIVTLPFAGAILPSLMVRVGRNACAIATASVTLLALALLLTHVPAVVRGDSVAVSWPWLAQLGLNVSFYLDGLGLLFAGLILGIGLLIIIYGRFYLSDRDPMGTFYTYLLLFQGAMIGIVLSDNILLLLIFWELTSLSSFLLIGYWRHLPEGRQGARMALAVTGGGGLALIAGMLLLGEAAGSYELQQILQQRELIQASPLYLPALLLILLGCFTKSAQFPFHFWLPHAMAAPTPVSAYLHSATMVKAGIFLLARLWPVLSGTDLWFYTVTTTGLVTMLIGALIALFKDDLKALLAFSTVSHLGLITMLLGLATPMAAVAALFHIINHATFKAALFMNAGIIDHETGSRDIKRLGGLLLLMPITATLALLAAASMAGIAPLNGFLSKELMLEATTLADWAGNPWLLAALATLAALLSVAYSFRYIVHVFFGPAGAATVAAHDPPAGLWLPPALLVALVVLIGLMPETLAGGVLRLAASAVTGGQLPSFQLALWHGLTPALGLSLLATAGGLLLLARYRHARIAWQACPQPQAKVLFDRLLGALITACQRLVLGLHNGSLQRYIAALLCAVLVLGVTGFFSSSYDGGNRPLLAAGPALVVPWLLLTGCTIAAVILHRQRFVSLMIIGVNGLIVSLGFVYLSAPDLALTQISVEVVTVILMLLALYFLPKQTPRAPSILPRLRGVLLALSCGIGVGALSWAVMTRDFTTLSGYYLAQAKPGGGGSNVVNVILVDFRGFDTFGEIIVLGIAALAIVALLDGALRGRIAPSLANWQPDEPTSADNHPLIMVVATRLMLPMALMVAAYIFLRGHNMPGGGFIAGLVAAIALIMQYMASGFGWATRQVKFDYHAMIGCGVLIAAATGIAAMVMGFPFLTSTFGYFQLPLIGEVELASAMVFDTGVFLTVVGAVMLALAALSRMGHRLAKLPVSSRPPLPRRP